MMEKRIKPLCNFSILKILIFKINHHEPNKNRLFPELKNRNIKTEKATELQNFELNDLINIANC